MGRIAILAIGDVFFVVLLVNLFINSPTYTYLPGIGMGLLLGIAACFFTWRSYDPAKARTASQQSKKTVPIAVFVAMIASNLLIILLSQDVLAVVGIGLLIGMLIFLSFAIVLFIRYPPQEDT
jgi:hypothetical protein